MQSTHEPGEIVGERYRILGILGRGGVGITYVAEDVETHERVALKQLQLWHQHAWKVLDLFQREARVLAGLAHERIPRYLGYLQLEATQQFYLVQQIAPGHPLPHWVGIGWRPTEAQARALAAQLLDVLVYLHSLSPPVIHRDIKPGNVIRTEDGRLSLVDFGAVRDTYQSTLEQGSTIAGTYGYMAPEQFRGHASPASDLYGVGATMIYLLSQRSPAELPERAGRIRFRRYVRVSRGFAGWLERMVAPVPEKRFGSATAALRALSSLGKTSLQRTLVATAAATAVVLPIAAGAALWWPKNLVPGDPGVAATRK